MNRNLTLKLLLTFILAFYLSACGGKDETSKEAAAITSDTANIQKSPGCENPIPFDQVPEGWVKADLSDFYDYSTKQDYVLKKVLLHGQYEEPLQATGSVIVSSEINNGGDLNQSQDSVICKDMGSFKKIKISTEFPPELFNQWGDYEAVRKIDFEFESGEPVKQTSVSQTLPNTADLVKTFTQLKADKDKMNAEGIELGYQFYFTPQGDVELRFYQINSDPKADLNSLFKNPGSKFTMHGSAFYKIKK